MNILLTSNQIFALESLLAILMLIISYIIGSIPFGLLLGKLIKHVDIREHGSKNIGTTNSIRVLGKKVGFLVFFCDVFKGMIMIIIIKILRNTGVYTTPVEDIWFGVFAIVGHSFSIFLNFKGGKAVATSLGVILMICPLAGILCLITFYLVLKLTGYVSLASTFATITVFTTTWILHFVGIDSKNFIEYFINKIDLTTCILVSLMALLIILKHIKNYKRLINGTENSFKKKKEIKQ